jgi:hypothetical protein
VPASIHHPLTLRVKGSAFSLLECPSAVFQPESKTENPGILKCPVPLGVEALAARRVTSAKKYIISPSFKMGFV